MLDELADRLGDALGQSGDPEFAKLVKAPARIRGHALERLVGDALSALSDD
jgi:hypothetical protein